MKLLISDFTNSTRFLSRDGQVVTISSINPTSVWPFTVTCEDGQWTVTEDGRFALNPNSNETSNLDLVARVPDEPAAEPDQTPTLDLTPDDVGKSYISRDGQIYTITSSDEGQIYPYRARSDNGDIIYVTPRGRYYASSKTESGFDLIAPASEPTSGLNLTPEDVGKLFKTRSGKIAMIDRHDEDREAPFHIVPIDLEIPEFLDAFLWVRPDGLMFPGDTETTEADLIEPYDKADSPEVELLLGLLILSGMVKSGVFDDLPRH